MTKTMTARYRGTCRSCAGTIHPGEMINHAGRGRSYHVACTGGIDREPTWKQRYGRCEDAPCCGCCD
jgi:hypothetical protein